MKVVKSRLAVIFLTALAASSCGNLVIKVGKGNLEEAPPARQSASNSSKKALSITDLESYLTDLDKLKEEAPQIIIEQLRTGWRGDFRKAIRQFRDAIQRNAVTEHSYENRVFEELNKLDCTKIQKVDLSVIEGIEDLGVVLKGAMLAKLGQEGASKLNPALAPLVNEITEIFLFEMGISIEGSSKVEVVGNQTHLISNLKFKVESEKGESPSVIANDENGVSLSFTRVLEKGKPASFKLDAAVASGLYEGSPKGPHYYMKLESSQEIMPENGGRHVTIVVENGLDVQKVYSRKLEYSEMGEKRDLYILKDTIRFGLADEEIRVATIDLAEAKSCRPPEDAEGKDSEGPSKGDPVDKGDEIVLPGPPDDSDLDDTKNPSQNNPNQNPSQNGGKKSKFPV